MSASAVLQDPSLWIGEVPDRWRMAKGKELFVQVKRPDAPELEVVTAFRDGVVTRRSNRRTTGFTEAVQFSGYQGVQPGDLVIHQMDGFAGAIGVSDSTGRCSPVCAVAIPRSTANPYYYARVLRAMAVSGWIAALAKGIRERSTDFRFSVFREQLVPVPSPEEQELIVRYLDHAEMRIAKAIAGKSNLVALLVERKAAIEAELLLGTQMSADSTTWFGELPDGWTRLPARALCDERNDRDRDDLSLLSVTIRRGVVSQKDYISSAGSKKDQSRSDKSQYKAVQPGDVVYNKMRAWQGAAGCSALEGIVSPAYVVVRPRELIVPEFLGRVMRTPQFAKEAERWSYGINSDMWSLRPHHFKLIEFAVPPLDVQHKLVAQVLDRTSELEEAITAIENEIALLKEYRVRLISDVVTGKLDVRAEAANLPDVDPLELAAVLAGGTASTDEEEGADGDD